LQAYNKQNEGFTNFSNFFSPLRTRRPSTSSTGYYGGGDPMSLEKAAKMHRNSAALYDANCTWSGRLPDRYLTYFIASVFSHREELIQCIALHKH
jgi:hypothetical protein